jgi:hypothetical protein
MITIAEKGSLGARNPIGTMSNFAWVPVIGSSTHVIGDAVGEGGDRKILTRFMSVLVSTSITCNILSKMS